MVFYEMWLLILARTSTGFSLTADEFEVITLHSFMSMAWMSNRNPLFHADVIIHLICFSKICHMKNIGSSLIHASKWEYDGTIGLWQCDNIVHLKCRSLSSITYTVQVNLSETAYHCGLARLGYLLSWALLVHPMARCLLGAKPLETSGKIETKYNDFQSVKFILKCYYRGHFAQVP